MTKNRSKMLIICLSLILIVGLVASFVSFTYPLSIGGVKYEYSSFVNELVLGSDISEGVLFEYQVRDSEGYGDFDGLMDNTLVDLRNILNDSGFKNSTISRNVDGIRVEVGGSIEKDDSDEVINLIGSPAKLTFSTSTNPDDAFMSGYQYVKSVSAKNMSNGIQSVYYVEISFTDKGYDIISKKSADVVAENGSIYMLLGDTQIGSSSEAITTKSLTMTSDNFVDMATTEEYAIKIRTGMLPLDLICSYNGIISATSG
ncbi:MAG: hypothetical protein J6Q15_03150, partial [Clostridia bacterium]|nr:hypothetical protein [Clostridia bacterium]